MTQWHVVVQVFRKTAEQEGEELMVQVGGRESGPDSFVQAFPAIYNQIDKQISKVLEMGEIADQPAPTPKQENE